MKIAYMAAAEDDDKSVDFFGVRFEDGKPQEIDEAKNPKLVEKARINPTFRVEEKAAEKPASVKA